MKRVDRPDDARSVATAPTTRLMTLEVSRTTVRFLREGHPWVRPDRFTRGLDRVRPGQAVTLVDAHGTRLASALADPGAEVCARVYHRAADRPFAAEAALQRAIERRAALHGDAATDCYRLVHGEGDFLPGVRIERCGDVLIVLVLAAAIRAHVPALCRVLHAWRPQATVLIREHVDDLRVAGVADRCWTPQGDIAPPAADTVVLGRELGLRYPLRPFAGLATGLYSDQRATRAWLQPQAQGTRVLNCFGYTGAFSLALLRAGAASAVDVDLSAPSLARASEAAALNGLAERHRTVQADCRSFLAQRERDLYDLIIVDPPTSAQGGNAESGRGWVLRRDYPELLRLAAARLAPGGALIAVCNTVHGKPFPLRDTVLGLGLVPIDGPPLGSDLPQLTGFPEGRPFRLVAARRSP